MKPNSGVRTLFIVSILFLIQGAHIAQSRWEQVLEQSDFMVYYTAATLVRTGNSLHIYDGSRPDTNPQNSPASPDSIFAQTAEAFGLTSISLYLYPPTLADLMTPLTLFSPLTALHLWWLLNAAALLASALIMASLLGVRHAAHRISIVAFCFILLPTLECFRVGQVSILLLLLLIAGIWLYLRGYVQWAGLLFALATAIKLTPLILIVPLLVWRDWKTLRAFFLGGLAILGLLWFVNGPAMLRLYSLHLMPAISSGFPDIDDRTFSTLLLEYWRGIGHASVTPLLLWVSRIVSFLVLAAAAWLSRSGSKHALSDQTRFDVLAVFLLLSCCIAPVSWIYSYVRAIPLLVLLGLRLWRSESSTAESTVLFLFLIAISVNLFPHFTLATPLLGSALCLLELHRLRREGQFGQTAVLLAEAAQPPLASAL